MSRASLIASFALLVVCLAAPPVSAQQQRTDPDASSPAGVIYEIPFDTARKDAAPKNARGGKGGSGGDASSKGSSNAGGNGSSGSSGSSAGSGGGSNGSGSGSAAGGGSGGSDDDSSGAGGGAGGSGGGGSGGSGGSGSGNAGGGGGSGGSGDAATSDNPNVGTSIHSENGFGSSSKVPGVAGATVSGDGPPSSALRSASSSSNTSPLATYGLLVILALVGGWIGLAASRGLRPSSR